MENTPWAPQMMQRLLDDHADMIRNKETPFYSTWGCSTERMAYLDHYLDHYLEVVNDHTNPEWQDAYQER